MERAVVAGVDGGGTKTECWVADLQGQVLGRGTARGANLLATERAAVQAALQECLSEALQAAGRTVEDLRAVCLAIAGFWPGRVPDFTPELFRSLFPEPIHIRLEPDVAAALQSAVGDGPGIALIAGTGSIAFGRDAAGSTVRAGGWGHLLGDEGSAYWIGLRAAQAALRSADGREAETMLATTIPAAFGVARPEELVAIAHQTDRLGKAGMAALAPLVSQAAEAGDGVAAAILAAAANELALLATTAAARLGMCQERFPVVAAGGVFHAGERILAPLREQIGAVCPHASLSVAPVRPAWGAVLFALKEAGVTEVVGDQ
jgi:N-acetylmuramic acid 6-phosphate etherase